MKDRVINILQIALEKEEDNIELSDNFKEYIEWDSLSRLSLIAEIDSEFDVQIEDNDFEALETVEDLYKEISKRKGSETQG